MRKLLDPLDGSKSIVSLADKGIEIVKVPILLVAFQNTELSNQPIKNYHS